MPVACTRALPSDKTGPTHRGRRYPPPAPADSVCLSIRPSVRSFVWSVVVVVVVVVAANANISTPAASPGGGGGGPRPGAGPSVLLPSVGRSVGGARSAAGDRHHATAAAAAAAAMDPRSNIAPSQLRACVRATPGGGSVSRASVRPSRVTH